MVTSPSAEVTPTPGLRRVRLGIGAATLLVVLSVTTALVRHPRAATAAPVTTVLFLTALAGLLAAYLWAARAAARPRCPSQALAVRLGSRFGVVVALCWIAEIIAGNVLGNHAYSNALYGAALLGVATTTVAAGAVTTVRVHRFAAGVVAGVWSGIVSGTIPMLTLLAITLLAPDVVTADPQNIAEAGRSGTDVLVFVVGDDIVAGINHLWLGPLLGLVLGALGSLGALADGSRGGDAGTSGRRGRERRP